MDITKAPIFHWTTEAAEDQLVSIEINDKGFITVTEKNARTTHSQITLNCDTEYFLNFAEFLARAAVEIDGAA